MAEMRNDKLSAEEMEKVTAWLFEHHAAQPCPACLHPQWTVGDLLVLSQTFNRHGPLPLGVGYPAVVIFCNRCGFMRFHSAYAMGLMPPTSAEKPEEGKHGG